ncbi:MAG: flavodoxin-dependent (E)-4-hydroxy-3-methylbut-2-enyl-diphosphate synthase [Deltaproteobacteria bacterium]|nr:flavodoxin-dependent (E)-4-hydroxy-3-methylbut-2-enyl-diphosphate synthase [Deltaproteobacteria bacterium]
MTAHRETTRRLDLGGVRIGGGAPVSVQSMTNTNTADTEATLEQIRRLKMAGCDIVRVAVPDKAAAAALPEIVAGAGLPVVADIHFDYRLALDALDAGCAGLRINPGNIGAVDRVKVVAREAERKGAVIRVGVNAGSLESAVLENGKATATAMVRSAERHVALLEDAGFESIKVSLKASDRQRTIDANRMWAASHDLPLHLGLTEAGTLLTGATRSAAVLGELLGEGIGDTLRISLCADPVQEVFAGIELLRVMGLRKTGIRVIACPTCGRCADRFDVASLAGEIESKLAVIETTKSMTVAVMGCAVNGPGEARDADLGVAGGRSKALLFKRGEKIGAIEEGRVVETVLAEIEEMLFK